MITNREWRQIAIALFHGGFGQDQTGNVLLYLKNALGILKPFAAPGADFTIENGRIVVAVDPKHDEPEVIQLRNPIRAPAMIEALEVLKTGGSDIGEDTDLVTAAHVVIGDLKSAISGRDFWKTAAEGAEKSVQALAERIRVQEQRIAELEQQNATHEANLACAQAALKQDRLILESFSLDDDFSDRPERTAVVNAIDGIDGVLKGISLEKIR